MLRSAAEHERTQQRIQRSALAQARSLRSSPTERLWRAVTSWQGLAAVTASRWLPAMLDEQGIVAEAVAPLVLASQAGTASDGRSLRSLLEYAARESTSQEFDTIVATQLQDVARSTLATGIATRPTIDGYARQITAGACSRCAILAGRFYRWNEGFERHPNCFPAGVVVSGPETRAATRRLYQGELVVLTTASGQELPVTGNHPVLTSRGWVPANLLKEGDEVVRSTRGQGATALVVPHHDEMPSRIEDVWGALAVAGLDTMETSPEDFHGDGQHGEVDIVWTDRALDDWLLSAFAQEVREQALSLASWLPLPLDGQGMAKPLDLGYATHSGGSVRGFDLGLAIAGRQGLAMNLGGLAHGAPLHPGLLEPVGDRTSGDSVLHAEGVFAGTGSIGSGNLLGRQVADASRWDAPAGPLTLKTRDGYARQGLDVLHRLSGQVELDRVVKLSRREFRGHVYSLTSSEGWHSANSLIVSNCNCEHVPTTREAAGDVTTSPRGYFDSLDAAEQDRIFTKAGAEAIRLGADPVQVVNARAGMSTAQISPQGRVMSRGRLTRDENGLFTTEEGARTQRARRALGLRPGEARLMPESILELSGGDRDQALTLLQRHGYIR